VLTETEGGSEFSDEFWDCWTFSLNNPYTGRMALDLRCVPSGGIALCHGVPRKSVESDTYGLLNPKRDGSGLWLDEPKLDVLLFIFHVEIDFVTRCAPSPLTAADVCFGSCLPVRVPLYAAFGI
jgi:hypothetical protein